MRRVLVIGSATKDTIVQGSTSRRRRKMGGVVVYGGITFQRMGVVTSVVTNVASEDRGFRNLFARESIDCRIGPSRCTTTFLERLDGDERALSLDGVAAP